MKKLLLAMLLALSFTANAQHMGTLPPNADGRLYYSWDSDKFTVLHSWIGASHESGIGARVGYSQYKGNHLIGGYRYVDNPIDYELKSEYRNNKFTADSTVFQLTYVNVGENHDFQGAIGVRKTDYNTSADGIDLALKQADELLLGRTGAGVVNSEGGYYTEAGDITKSQLSGSRDTLVANAELKLLMTDRLTIGAAVATDLVESPRSIQTGTTYVYTAADADYLITENLNFNVIAGNMHFSDNNDRPFIRTKTTWTFLPEHGVSVHLRTRNQYDTNPGGFNYYSPDTLAQQAIGLNIRKPYNGLVYTAGVEFGSEQVVDVSGTKDVHPLYGWQLGVQTSPGRKTGVTYGVSLIGSNATGFNGGGQDYSWYGLNSWIKVPLK